MQESLPYPIVDQHDLTEYKGAVRPPVPIHPRHRLPRPFQSFVAIPKQMRPNLWIALSPLIRVIPYLWVIFAPVYTVGETNAALKALTNSGKCDHIGFINNGIIPWHCPLQDGIAAHTPGVVILLSGIWFLWPDRHVRISAAVSLVFAAARFGAPIMALLASGQTTVNWSNEIGYYTPFGFYSLCLWGASLIGIPLVGLFLALSPSPGRN